MKYLTQLLSEHFVPHRKVIPTPSSLQGISFTGQAGREPRISFTALDTSYHQVAFIVLYCIGYGDCMQPSQVVLFLGIYMYVYIIELELRKD